MKLLTTLIVTLLACGSVFADPPQSFRADRYKDLFTKSPFTDPPVVDEPEPPVDPFPDWTLVGIRKYVDRVKVTILNVKDRNERITIPSKEASEMGFSIKEVRQARNYLNSEVVLNKGKFTGTVAYDPKFLVLKRVAAPANRNKQQQQRSSGARQTNSGGNSKSNPPTPPGASGRSSTGAQKTNTPPRPGSQPSTSSTKGSSSSSKSKRTRYVPRPSK